MKVTVVIPNYNGIAYVADCLDALRKQTGCAFHTIVVDNGSTDGSYELVRDNYPEAACIRFPENTGFCKAVNAGIKASHTPYVILLNNDTKVLPGFVKALVKAVEASPDIFSVSAMMLQMNRPDRIDDAGDFYSALGWAYARGKDKPASDYQKGTDIFAACGGAAIYRRSIFQKIGLFDEQHFAYLEDIDIGYRARLAGYRNRYEPKAKVLHAGSGSSGSRYNAFKVKHSAANNIYLIYKNMPLFQILLNFPLLAAGFFIKFLFFISKGMGMIYLNGIRSGFQKCRSREGRRRKIRYQSGKFARYAGLQIELWTAILRKV